MDDQPAGGNHKPDILVVGLIVQAFLDNLGNLLDLGLGGCPETRARQVPPGARGGEVPQFWFQGKASQENRRVQSPLDGMLGLNQLGVIQPADGVDGHKKSQKQVTKSA